MPEKLNFVLFLDEPVHPAIRKKFVLELFNAIPEWIKKPKSMMALDCGSMDRRYSDWNDDNEELFTEPKHASILFVYSEGRAEENRTRSGISIFDHNGVVTYTVFIDLLEFHTVPVEQVEDKIVLLFNTARAYSPCVVAVGTELEFGENITKLSAAIDEGLSSFQNAYWVALDGALVSDIPAGFIIARQFEGNLLLSRHHSLAAHIFLT